MESVYQNHQLARQSEINRFLSNRTDLSNNDLNGTKSNQAAVTQTNKVRKNDEEKKNEKDLPNARTQYNTFKRQTTQYADVIR